MDVITTMIAETIRKERRTLADRGVHDGSFFHVVFSDGSEAKEHDTNWSDISEETAIEHLNGSVKLVMLSKHPTKTLTVHCAGLSSSLDLQEGDRVYQAIRSVASANGTHKNVGRIVGIVRDGRMVEERFLSSEQGQVFGLRQ